jgi:hypothetical protein
MGAIENEQGLRAARRDADAERKQAATRSAESDALGLDRRRDFMLASGRVFFESIIDQSDLMPVRSLAVGLLAGQAVGRIHLPPKREHGDGFASGFPNWWQSGARSQYPLGREQSTNPRRR